MPPNRTASCARWLFVATAGFYLLMGTGAIQPPDGAVMFNVTESLTRGRLDIDRLLVHPEFGGVAVEDPSTHQPRFYGKYGLAYSLIGIPLDLLGAAAGHAATEGDRQLLNEDVAPHTIAFNTAPGMFPRALRSFFVSNTNAFVVAALLVLLFLFLLELGFRLPTALISAGIVAIGTPLWQAALDQFSDPLGALGAVGCALFARRSAWGRAGAFLGLSMLAKPANAVLCIPALLLIVLYLPRSNMRALLERGIRFGTGLLCLVSVELLYNLARFGRLLEAGYGSEVGRWDNPFIEGFLGLLISPGRGFLLYAPLWVLLLPAAGSLWKRCRVEALFGLAIFATLLLTYARWYQWEGGWCWGPRYLLPAVPFLALPLAALIEHPARSVVHRTVLVAVVLVAIVYAWNGTRVNALEFTQTIVDEYEAHADQYRADGLGTYYHLVRWDPGDAPMTRYWKYEPLRKWLLEDAIRKPGVILATLLAGVVAWAAACARLLFLVFSRQQPARRESG